MKHVLPRSRFIYKIWKAEKISFFSTECPRSSNSAGNARTVIAWPRHYDLFMCSAKSPTFLWSFKPDTVKYLASVKWRAAIWQSIKDTHRDEKGVAIATISASVASWQHIIYKAVARPASKQRRSPAHITSYPDEESTFYERNPADGGKQGPI